MITQRYHGLIRLHFLLKQVGNIVIFWAIVWFLHLAVYGPELLPSTYLWVSFLVPAAAVFELWVRDEGRRSLGGLSRAQVSYVTQREVLYALVAIFGVIVMGKEESLSRVFLGVFFLCFSAWIAWMNHVGYRMLHRSLYRRKSGSQRPNTVVLAPPREIERDGAMHMSGSVPGAEFLGYVNYGPGQVATLPALPVLGDFSELREICREARARLLLALGLEDRPDLVHSLQQLCDSLGMRLIWVDDTRERFRGNLDSHREGTRLFLTNWREPLEDPMNRVIKRTFDFAFASTVCVAVLPPLCLLVKSMQVAGGSRGPLFYRQRRTGRDGEVFEVYKFRTMHLNDTPGAQAQAGDSRIYRGGGFLRRSSLDEMPQFLNVLFGQMSVVGPRPHFVDHDEQFAGIVDDYQVRQFAKPGITGLAQVKGCRGETDTPGKVRRRVRLDHFYLRHWSPMLDLCIVADTVAQVVFPPKSAR